MGETKFICFAFLLAVLLLAQGSAAFSIEGTSVAAAEAGIRLSVTPHTSSSPVGQFSQEFEVCNEAGENAELFVGYVFGKELESASVMHWEEPEYSTIRNRRVCENELGYERNAGSGRNRHRAWCHYTLSDANGYSEDVVEWEQDALWVSTARKVAYWDEEELVSGNSWAGVTTLFQEGQAVEAGILYPLKESVLVNSGSCAKWRLDYEPNVNEETNKWELWAWKGENWNCILDGSCGETIVLDPWWGGSEWLHRQKVVIKTSDYLAGDVSNDHVILVPVDSSNADFWAGVDPAGKDVRFTNSADTDELKYYFQEFDYANKSMLAWVKVTDTFTAASDVTIYIYYGNNEALDAQDAPGTLANFEAVYHADETSGLTVPDATGKFDASASNIAIWDTTNKWLGEAALGAYPIEQDTLLDTVPANGFSISFWFRPNSELGAGIPSDQHFFDKWSSLTDQRIMANINKTYGKIDTFLNYGQGPKYLWSTTATWEKDTWYFYTMTWNTAEGAASWINGGEEDRAADCITMLSGGGFTNFFIGSSNVPHQHFNGQIDEFRVFNVGLTSDEVLLLYHSELGDLVEFEDGDEDGDGVNDRLDECPNTPAGEVVDAVGCSCSQKTCDDANPCTDDSCNAGTAQCEYVNNNANLCGSARDCEESTCLFRDQYPYFFWRLFPPDGHDYCLEGACMEYSCALVSEDYNAECGPPGTSDLEKRVGELETQVDELQGQVGILESALAALQQAFNGFVELINIYLSVLPSGLRQQMVCAALEESGESRLDALGLLCFIAEDGKCNCIEAIKVG